MRSTLKTKNSQGYAIDQPPLGYKKDPDNPKLWVIDEEAAQIIEKIYNLRKQGESTVKIAKLLKFEKILIPSMYAAKKGYRKPSIKNPRNEYLWTVEMVRKILMNQSYVDDVVNFKTYSTRVPRHASREQIIVLFFSFIARVFVSVGKLFNFIRLIHKKR